MWLIETIQREWSILLYIGQIIASEALFCLPLQRKKHFVLRAGLFALIFIPVAFFVPVLLVDYMKGFITIYIFLLSFALYPICFKGSIFELLFCYISALIAQNLASSAGVLVSYLFRVSPSIRESGGLTAYVQTPTFIVVMLTAAFLCRFRTKGKALEMRSPFVIVITCVSIFFIFFLHVILKNMGYQYFWPTTLLFFFCDLILLFILYGLFEQSKLRNEISILEQLMEKERKQYVISKQTIDLINYKCHDIKHQIFALKESGNITHEQIEKLTKEINIYEHSAKTGNGTLDVILSEKSLICESKKITLTYIIHGEALKDMDSFDIASIFGNLLDNAIQYLEQLDEEKRNISLQVFSQSGFLTIHTENYCEENYQVNNNTLETTKKDRNYHGYGLKSVKYIVEKYSGNFVISNNHRIFSVDIIIPMPLKEKKLFR